MKAEGVSTYHLPDVSVDVSAHRVTRNGEDVGLPDLSYQLLRALCERAPELVTKDELIAEVWKHQAVSDETLAQRIRLLRKGLGENSPAARAIVSVRGRGYRIAAAVTVDAAPNLTLPGGDVQVYNDYLLGRHLTFQLTSASLDQAVRVLERVTSKAPEFAQAFCTLGWAYSFLGTSYGGRPPKEVFHHAKSAALRAVSLNPKLAESHSLYADILAWYDWDFATAEREHKAAIAIDENLTLGYMLLLSAVGRHDEAIALAETQLARAPDDVYLRTNAAWRYLDAGASRGDLERAAALAGSSRDHADALTIEAIARLMLGDVSEALRLFEEDHAAHPEDPSRLANLARGLYASGNAVRAREIEEELHGLTATRFVSPFLLAVPRFAAGDADAGFDHLNDAVEARVREMIFLKVSTVLHDYREDRRFLALLDAIGLPRTPG